MRPAATLPSRPGNEFSCQPTYDEAIRSTTASAVRSSTPDRFEGPPPDGLAQPGAQRDDQLERAADAENHAHAVAVEPALGGVAGVFERLSWRSEPEKLGGIGGLDRVRGDAEIQRGKSTGERKPPRRQYVRSRALGS